MTELSKKKSLSKNMVNTSNLIQWRRVQILSATFFCITFALLSCKKKETMVGKDAFDPSNLLGSISTDTFKLKTYTIAEDPTKVVTKDQLHAMVGAYNDPKFGIVNAGFYTQVSLDNPGATSFGDNPTVDSIVLSLQYTGYYGKTTTQTFEVHELTEDLSADTTVIYHMNTTKTYDPNDLVITGKGTITPKPTTKISIGTDTTKLAAQLRLPLENSFAEHLMDGVQAGHYSTQDAFRAFFKGLHVKVTNQNPSSGDGAVYYFGLSALNSKLTIFYKSGGAAKTFAYLMNGKSVDFTHMDFNRVGKPIDNVINNPALGQSEFYAQAFTSRAVVEIPGLQGIPKNSIIHKAQLILPVSYYTNDLLYPSAQLNFGTKVTLVNDTIYSRANMTFDNTLKCYTVDMRLQVQQVVSQLIANRGVFLRPTFFTSTTERIIFNGPQSVNKKKPKLVVTYTTY